MTQNSGDSHVDRFLAEARQRVAQQKREKTEKKLPRLRELPPGETYEVNSENAEVFKKHPELYELLGEDKKNNLLTFRENFSVEPGPLIRVGRAEGSEIYRTAVVEVSLGEKAPREGTTGRSRLVFVRPDVEPNSSLGEEYSNSSRYFGGVSIWRPIDGVKVEKLTSQKEADDGGRRNVVQTAFVLDTDRFTEAPPDSLLDRSVSSKEDAAARESLYNDRMGEQFDTDSDESPEEDTEIDGEEERDFLNDDSLDDLDDLRSDRAGNVKSRVRSAARGPVRLRGDDPPTEEEIAEAKKLESLRSSSFRGLGELGQDFFDTLGSALAEKESNDPNRFKTAPGDYATHAGAGGIVNITWRDPSGRAVSPGALRNSAEFIDLFFRDPELSRREYRDISDPAQRVRYLGDTLRSIADRIEQNKLQTNEATTLAEEKLATLAEAEKVSKEFDEEFKELTPAQQRALIAEQRGSSVSLELAVIRSLRRNSNQLKNIRDKSASSIGRAQADANKAFGTFYTELLKLKNFVSDNPDVSTYNTSKITAALANYLNNQLEADNRVIEANNQIIKEAIRLARASDTEIKARSLDKISPISLGQFSSDLVKKIREGAEQNDEKARERIRELIQTRLNLEKEKKGYENDRNKKNRVEEIDDKIEDINSELTRLGEIYGTPPASEDPDHARRTLREREKIETAEKNKQNTKNIKEIQTSVLEDLTKEEHEKLQEQIKEKSSDNFPEDRITPENVPGGLGGILFEQSRITESPVGGPKRRASDLPGYGAMLEFLDATIEGASDKTVEELYEKAKESFERENAVTTKEKKASKLSKLTFEQAFDVFLEEHADKVRERQGYSSKKPTTWGEVVSNLFSDITKYNKNIGESLIKKTSQIIKNQKEQIKNKAIRQKRDVADHIPAALEQRRRSAQKGMGPNLGKVSEVVATPLSISKDPREVFRRSLAEYLDAQHEYGGGRGATREIRGRVEKAVNNLFSSFDALPEEAKRELDMGLTRDEFFSRLTSEEEGHRALADVASYNRPERVIERELPLFAQTEKEISSLKNSLTSITDEQEKNRVQDEITKKTAELETYRNNLIRILGSENEIYELEQKRKENAAKNVGKASSRFSVSWLLPKSDSTRNAADKEEIKQLMNSHLEGSGLTDENKEWLINNVDINKIDAEDFRRTISNDEVAKLRAEIDWGWPENFSADLIREIETTLPEYYSEYFKHIKNKKKNTRAFWGDRKSTLEVEDVGGIVNAARMDRRYTPSQGKKESQQKYQQRVDAVKEFYTYVDREPADQARRFRVLTAARLRGQQQGQQRPGGERTFTTSGGAGEIEAQTRLANNRQKLAVLETNNPNSQDITTIKQAIEEDELVLLEYRSSRAAEAEASRSPEDVQKIREAVIGNWVSSRDPRIKEAAERIKNNQKSLGVLDQYLSLRNDVSETNLPTIQDFAEYFNQENAAESARNLRGVTMTIVRPEGGGVAQQPSISPATSAPSLRVPSWLPEMSGLLKLSKGDRDLVERWDSIPLDVRSEYLNSLKGETPGPRDVFPFINNNFKYHVNIPKEIIDTLGKLGVEGVRLLDKIQEDMTNKEDAAKKNNPNFSRGNLRITPNEFFNQLQDIDQPWKLDRQTKQRFRGNQIHNPLLEESFRTELINKGENITYDEILGVLRKQRNERETGKGLRAERIQREATDLVRQSLEAQGAPQESPTPPPSKQGPRLTPTEVVGPGIPEEPPADPSKPPPRRVFKSGDRSSSAGFMGMTNQGLEDAKDLAEGVAGGYRKYLEETTGRKYAPYSDYVHSLTFPGLMGVGEAGKEYKTSGGDVGQALFGFGKGAAEGAVLGWALNKLPGLGGLLMGSGLGESLNEYSGHKIDTDYAKMLGGVGFLGAEVLAPKVMAPLNIAYMAYDALRPWYDVLTKGVDTPAPKPYIEERESPVYRLLNDLDPMQPQKKKKRMPWEV